MSQARSQRLITDQIPAGGNSPGFICPDGHVTLVKNLYGNNQAAAASTVSLIATIPGASFAVALATIQAPPGQTFEWVGWVAMNPGDLVYIVASEGPVDVWLSGAILNGPNQFAPVDLNLLDRVTTYPSLPPGLA